MSPNDGPLREPLEFADTDGLLRDDVRRLGAMVGEMLAEQVSADFLARVERPPPARLYSSGKGTREPPCLASAWRSS